MTIARVRDKSDSKNEVPMQKQCLYFASIKFIKFFVGFSTLYADGRLTGRAIWRFSASRRVGNVMGNPVSP